MVVSKWTGNELFLWLPESVVEILSVAYALSHQWKRHGTFCHRLE